METATPEGLPLRSEPFRRLPWILLALPVIEVVALIGLRANGVAALIEFPWVSAAPLAWCWWAFPVGLTIGPGLHETWMRWRADGAGSRAMLPLALGLVALVAHWSIGFLLLAVGGDGVQ